MDWLILHDFCQAANEKVVRNCLGVFSFENGKLNIISNDRIADVVASTDEIELILVHGNYHIVVDEIKSVEYDCVEDTYLIEFKDGSIFTMS